MAKEEHKDDHPPPRWDIVMITYDKFDDVLTKSILDNEMNFLEIGMIMMMLDENMLQNKTALYMQYSSSLDENTTSNVKIEGADTNMY